MKNKRSKLLWGLWCIGVALGLIFSFQQTARINDLKRTHRDIRAKTGLLKVDDPTNVYVTRVIDPAIPLVLQHGTSRTWQFQMHLPSGYGPQTIKLGGPISADGLHSGGGSSSSSSSANKEAIRGLWTLTLQEEDGQWMLSSSGPSSTSRTTLRDVTIDSIDDLIINTICPEPGKTVEISPDVFFNLFQIRAAEKHKSRYGRKQETERYAGAALWIGPKASQPAFDAVSRGSKISEELAKVILND